MLFSVRGYAEFFLNRRQFLSTMETTVISFIAFGLLVYLVVAVLRPEKF